MTPSAIERVKSSIEIARRFLKSAERTFEIGDYLLALFEVFDLELVGLLVVKSLVSSHARHLLTYCA